MGGKKSHSDKRKRDRSYSSKSRTESRSRKHSRKDKNMRKSFEFFKLGKNEKFNSRSKSNEIERKKIKSSKMIGKSQEIIDNIVDKKKEVENLKKELSPKPLSERNSSIETLNEDILLDSEEERRKEEDLIEQKRKQRILLLQKFDENKPLDQKIPEIPKNLINPEPEASKIKMPPNKDNEKVEFIKAIDKMRIKEEIHVKEEIPYKDETKNEILNFDMFEEMAITPVLNIDETKLMYFLIP